MTSIHGTITPEPTPFEKFKNHVQQNPELYFTSACGVIGGLLLARGFGWRKPVKIDEAKVIEAWAERMVKSGYSIYALTNAQRGLWEAMHAFAEEEAKKTGWTIAKVLHEMTMDYKSFGGPPLTYAPRAV